MGICFRMLEDSQNVSPGRSLTTGTKSFIRQALASLESQREEDDDEDDDENDKTPSDNDDDDDSLTRGYSE